MTLFAHYWIAFRPGMARGLRRVLNRIVRYPSMLAGLADTTEADILQTLKLKDDIASRTSDTALTFDSTRGTIGNINPQDDLVIRYVETILPLDIYARELSLLKLAGTKFTAEVYAELLEKHLHIDIDIERSSPGNLPEGQLGSTRYDVEGARVHIKVARRLGWWMYQYTLFHELGHVAAGHPLPSRGPDGYIVSFKKPPVRLASRRPVDANLSFETRLAIYEEEAELRARYGMLTGQLGKAVVQTGNLAQVR